MLEARKQITGRDRERLTKSVVSKYRKGTSIRELADEHGRSYGFIHRLLVEAGTPLRGRGGSAGRTSGTEQAR
jgi:transposase